MGFNSAFKGLNSCYFVKKHRTNGSVRLLLATYSLQSPLNLTYRDFTQILVYQLKPGTTTSFSILPTHHCAIILPFDAMLSVKKSSIVK